MADVRPALTLAEPLLTAQQVAGLLGVSCTSVYKYARRTADPLPTVRVGRHVRFRRAAVEQWLARRET
jgi:excisionase family DNA binding protein